MTDDRCAEFLKSTRASGLPQVTHVIHDNFCAKACPQDLLVLICRDMLEQAMPRVSKIRSTMDPNDT